MRSGKMGQVAETVIPGIIAAVADGRIPDAKALGLEELERRHPLSILIEMAGYAAMLHRNPDVSLQQVAAVAQLEHAKLAEEDEVGPALPDSGPQAANRMLDAIERALQVANEDKPIADDPEFQSIVEELDGLENYGDGLPPIGMALHIAAVLMVRMKFHLFMTGLTSKSPTDADAAVGESIAALRSEFRTE